MLHRKQIYRLILLSSMVFGILLIGSPQPVVAGSNS